MDLATSRRIDLSNASDNELAHLSHFCAAATFGRDNEDVFDETYRKARKLDTKDFLCGFDPVHTGVLRAACQQILVGTDGTREIRAELYKLNVYGTFILGARWCSGHHRPRGVKISRVWNALVQSPAPTPRSQHVRHSGVFPARGPAYRHTHPTVTPTRHCTATLPSTPERAR